MYALIFALAVTTSCHDLYPQFPAPHLVDFWQSQAAEWELQTREDLHSYGAEYDCDGQRWKNVPPGCEKLVTLWIEARDAHEAWYCLYWGSAGPNDYGIPYRKGKMEELRRRIGDAAFRRGQMPLIGWE